MKNLEVISKLVSEEFSEMFEDYINYTLSQKGKIKNKEVLVCNYSIIIPSGLTSITKTMDLMRKVEEFSKLCSTNFVFDNFKTELIPNGKSTKMCFVFNII